MLRTKLWRDYALINGRNLATSVQREMEQNGANLTLEHFIQRKRALQLWRDIVRATHLLPHSSTRDELRTFARAEFERSRHVQDLGHIRYLISVGKTQFDSLRRSVLQHTQS